MKVQCDMCERAPATLICCADEAALCAKCDLEIHAANKLASKHQRLLLNCLSDKLPRCDICQEKTAFIFCVEDRALFCWDCDEAIHSTGSRSGNHQRLLATGIRVGLTTSCAKEAGPTTNYDPPNQAAPLAPPTMKNVPSPPHTLGYSPPTWAIDEFLQLPDLETNDKKEATGFDWLSDIALFEEGSTAEVPELPVALAANATYCRPYKAGGYSHKKPRIGVVDEEENFTVPDLG